MFPSKIASEVFESEKKFTLESENDYQSIFRYTCLSAPACFIRLLEHSKHHGLVVASGYWNEKSDSCPIDLAAMMYPYGLPELRVEKDEPEDGAFAFDVSVLWILGRGGEKWSKDRNGLSACYEKVTEFVVPYFDSLA